MKVDLTKLPVLEGIVGFLMLAIVLTFVGAFATTEGSDGNKATTTSVASATPADGETPGPGEVQLLLTDNKFDKTKLDAAAGTTVTFNLTNNGNAIHNMHIAPAAGADYTEDLCGGDADPCSDPATIRAGKTATLEWSVPENSGTYEFRCDFHPVEMKGEITVQ